jgi:hypothetical protein
MDQGEIQLFTDHDEALRVGEHAPLCEDHLLSSFWPVLSSDRAR